MSSGKNTEVCCNPFPGLRPFRSDEHHLFFGREEQAAALLQLLRTNRFLAVVGTSGSGKSSLVRAGLIPELHGGTMAQAGSTWEVLVLRPGGRPLENLARALIDADLYDRDDPGTLPRLRATLARSRFGLVEAVKQSEVIEPGANLLVVVDQFEELFRFRQQDTDSEQTATAFVNLLLTSSAQEERQIYVTLTMRSDYLGDCSEIPGLAEAVNRGEYLIPRLMRDQKRDAIEKPIGVGGARISPLLVQRLLNDIGDDQDQLPVLQHALMRMWEVWAATGDVDRPIDFPDFDATGGLTSALSRHADEVYHALPDDTHRAACEKIFKTLTEKGADNRGIRRPTRLERLEVIALTDHATAVAVLDAFRRPGVTFLMPGPDSELSQQTVIDLSHESLMRGWQRLRSWVEEEAQSARIFNRLSDTALLWRDGKAGLFRDPDLQIALSWREEERPNSSWAEQYHPGFDEAMAFLEASRKESIVEEEAREAARKRELEQAQQLAHTRERAARNFKRFALGMAAVAVMAAVAFVFAFMAQRRARHAEERVRSVFARSDVKLSQFYLEQEDTGGAIAHLSRSLEAVPRNPAVVDRLFNLLAYTSPPPYLSPPLDYSETHPLYSSVATPDGSLVFTSTSWSRVEMWTPGSSTLRSWNVRPGSGGVYFRCLALSPDGTRLFAGRSYDGGGTGPNSELIDVPNWSKIRDIPEALELAPQFSFRGDRYISGSRDGARIWDTETGELVKSIGSGTGWMFPIWSPDERHVALLNHTEPNVVAIAEVATGAITDLRHSHPVDWGVWYPSFSPDGTRILTQTIEEGSGMLWVWRIDTPAAEQFFLAHDPVESGLVIGEDPYAYWGEGWGGADERWQDRDDARVVGAFTPDGQSILTAGTDLTVRLWSASPEPMDPGERELHRWQISSQIAWGWDPLFSRDGRRFLIRTRDYGCYMGALPDDSGGFPDLVRSRHVNDGFAFLADNRAIKPLYLPWAQVISGAVHPLKPVIALGTVGGRVGQFDLRTGEALAPYLEHPGNIVEVAFNRDGSKLATRSDLGSLRVWDGATSEKLSSDSRAEAPATGGAGKAEFTVGDDVLAASKDGSLVLSTALRVTDRSTGRSVPIGSAGAVVEVATFSADGGRVAAARTGDGSVEIWSTSTGERLASLPHDSEVLTLDFHPDGQHLASGCVSGQVRLWRISSADGPEITASVPCRRVVFHSDGRMLATVFENGASSYAQIWDTATAQPITGKLESPGSISDAAFIEGGNRLVVWPQRSSGGQPGVAMVWDVSVSGGASAPGWLPRVATSFGGSRLNAESVPEPVREREPPGTRPGSPAEQRQVRFYQWLQEFPGTRPDSPFRPPVTDAYVETLIDQSDFALLDEAVRLRPRLPRALARRGLFRIPRSGSFRPGDRVLSTVDLTRSRLLDPEDPELEWYYGIALEVGGDESGSDAAYARAEALGEASRDALVRIVGVQDRFAEDLRVEPRQRLLSRAIEESGEASDVRRELATRLRIQRFHLSLDQGDYAAAAEDWQFIKEQDELPGSHSPEELLESLLKAVETEAGRMARENEEAVGRFLEPYAVVAELWKSFLRTDAQAADYWPPSSILSTLVEWENRQVTPVTFVPRGATWKYLDDGSDQGTAWRESGFDDSSWNGGPAKLGYGDDEEATTVGYGGDAGNKFVTTYFRHRFDVAEGNRKPFLDIDVVRDDGVIVYLNGVEVLRDFMPAGVVDYLTPAANTARESPRRDPEESREYRFPVDGRYLQIGENVIAAEVHQVNGTSSDIGFDLRMRGTEHSPGALLTRLLTGDGGPRQVDSTVGVLPKPLRVRWHAALVAATRTATEDLTGLDEDSLGAIYRLRGVLGDWQGSLETVERAIERKNGSGAIRTAVALRESLPWLRRRVIALQHLGPGRAEEQKLAEQATLALPRAPGLSDRLIDLDLHYNASLYDPDWHNGAKSGFSDLPETFEPHEGVDYDVRGMILLRSNKGITSGLPVVLRDIPIHSRAAAIYLLMGAVWGNDEEDGIEVARLTVQFADGTTDERPILLGEDVVDWNTEGAFVEPTRSRTAWRGPRVDDNRILSEVVWKNESRDKEIRSLDIRSAVTAVSPFVIGITLE